MRKIFVTAKTIVRGTVYVAIEKFMLVILRARGFYTIIIAWAIWIPSCTGAVRVIWICTLIVTCRNKIWYTNVIN